MDVHSENVIRSLHRKGCLSPKKNIKSMLNNSQTIAGKKETINFTIAEKRFFRMYKKNVYTCPRNHHYATSS